MVERILRIEDFLDDTESEHASEADRFLLEEGLELLAAYRSIQDQRIRKALLELVHIIAGSDADGETNSPAGSNSG